MNDMSKELFEEVYEREAKKFALPQGISPEQDIA